MKVPGTSRFFAIFLFASVFGFTVTAGLESVSAQTEDPVAPALLALAPPAAFIQVTVPAQGKVLTALPFVPFTQTASDAVRCTSGLGNGPLKLIRWNAAGLGYETLDYGDSGWQRAQIENGSTFALQPGDGFWLENKANQPVDCMIVGQIPIAPYLTNTFLSGLTLFGLPYPTARPLSDTPLAGEIAANGDRMYTWNGTNYSALTASNALEVSQGYWYQRNSESVAWPVERPYGEMFKGEVLPAVVALGHRPQGGVSVTIRPQEGGGTVDLLAQDLVKSAGFVADGTWQVVGKDLPVRDRDMDVLDSQAGKGRVYLALNSKDRDQIYAQTGEGIKLRPEWTQMGGDFGFELDYLDQLPGDTPADGITNGTPDGSNDVVFIPTLIINKHLVHVDSRSGRDTLSGYSLNISGKEGPKKTIHAGLAAAEKGGTVIVHEGEYNGQTLNIVGRDVTVRIDGNVNLSGSAAQTSSTILPDPAEVSGLQTNGITR